MDLNNNKINKIKNNSIIITRLKRSTFCALKLKLILKNKGNELKKDITILEEFLSFQDAMVISYASCFVEAGKGRAQYTENQIFAGKEDLLKIHQIIMEMRHKLVAHNDNNRMLTDSIIIKEDEYCIKIHFEAQLTLINLSDIIKILNLIEYVWNFMENKIKSIAENLSKEINKKVIIDNGMGQISETPHVPF